jgi:hypothetical protein
LCQACRECSRQTRVAQFRNHIKNFIKNFTASQSPAVSEAGSYLIREAGRLQYEFAGALCGFTGLPAGIAGVGGARGEYPAGV